MLPCHGDTRVRFTATPRKDISQRYSLSFSIRENGCLIRCRVSVSVDLTISTRYQTTNFRLFQTERDCRRQFQI